MELFKTSPLSDNLTGTYFCREPGPWARWYTSGTKLSRQTSTGFSSLLLHCDLTLFQPHLPAWADSMGSTLHATCCTMNGSDQSGQLISLSSLIRSKDRPLSQWEPRRHDLEPARGLRLEASSLTTCWDTWRGPARRKVDRGRKGEGYRRAPSSLGWIWSQ